MTKYVDGIEALCYTSHGKAKGVGAMPDTQIEPQTEAHAALVEQAYQGLRALMRAQQVVSAPIWAELDISVAQLKVLLALATEGPATIGQVADALTISLPTASHLVERLVQAGLVERTEDPRDRRRAVTRLTPPAEELTGRLFGCEHPLHGWLGELEEDDLAALSRGLRALLRAARGECPLTGEARRTPETNASTGSSR
jgi:DNA-binding MarR family transcriptional regulator